jgi:hypothetical protein
MYLGAAAVSGVVFLGGAFVYTRVVPPQDPKTLFPQEAVPFLSPHNNPADDCSKTTAHCMAHDNTPRETL